MATDARCPEWMLFYLRAQAQGAFGGPNVWERRSGSSPSSRN
jgi:hypothetical protein